MNNKGFLKILEAVIAITIVLGVMFVSLNKTTTVNEQDLNEKAQEILNEVGKNPLMRNAVLTGNQAQLDDFVRARIRDSSLEFEIKICLEVDSACGKSAYTESSVYSAERIVSASLTQIGPKKVRLFIWRP